MLRFWRKEITLLCLDLLSSSSFSNTVILCNVLSNSLVGTSARHNPWETIVKNKNRGKYNQKKGRFLQL